MKATNQMTWIDMIDDDFFWSGWNQAIGIGSTSSNYVFGYQSTNGSHRSTIKANGAASDVYSFFDTGLAGILISTYYFDDLITKIFRYVGDDNYKFVEGFIFS